MQTTKNSLMSINVFIHFTAPIPIVYVFYKLVFCPEVLTCTKPLLPLDGLGCCESVLQDSVSLLEVKVMQTKLKDHC